MPFMENRKFIYATAPYPEPDESSPHTHILFLWVILTLSSYLHHDLQRNVSPPGFPKIFL